MLVKPTSQCKLLFRSNPSGTQIRSLACRRTVRTHAVPVDGPQKSSRFPYGAFDLPGSETASSMVVVDNESHPTCTKLSLDVVDHPGEGRPHVRFFTLHHAA